MPRRQARKLKLMSSFFCLDGAVCLAPCCRRVNGRQEINLAKHTPRPGTSAVPASPGLQEIFILNGNRERRCPYTTSNVVSTDEERFLVSMRIRSEFYQHAAGERLGAEARPLAVANPRKGSFYRSEDVKTGFMPRLGKKNRFTRISSAPKARTLHSRPPLYRFQEIFHAIKTGRYPNRSKLAETIEVTTKTIQRDIDYMRYQMSVPIEFDFARGRSAFLLEALSVKTRSTLR